MTASIDSLVRKAAKALVLPLGLLDGRGPGDVVILVYHRVGGGPGEIDIPVSVFERHMEELAGEDVVLPLEEALGGHRGGVVVTFDDGTRDFHSAVLPVLVRYRIPATLYLATGLVEGTEGHGRDGWDPLTWSQLEEAVSTGVVTVGSHTHRHANLGQATEHHAEDEMRTSQALVEDRLGMPCRHFAYPWGVASPASERVARRLFDSAALRAWETNRRGRVDPHRLARVPILKSDGSMFFSAKRKGLLNGEALVYRALRRGPWRVV